MRVYGEVGRGGVERDEFMTNDEEAEDDNDKEEGESGFRGATTRVGVVLMLMFAGALEREPEPGPLFTRGEVCVELVREGELEGPEGGM